MYAQQETLTWTPALLVMALTGITLVVAGRVVISVARRTADGRLGRNGLAGIRTKATRSSDEAWHAAHTVGLVPTVLAGKVAMATGPVAMALGLALGRNPERAMLFWGVVLGMGTVALTGLVVYGGWKGNLAAKEVMRERQRPAAG